LSLLQVSQDRGRHRSSVCKNLIPADAYSASVRCRTRGRHRTRQGSRFLPLDRCFQNARGPARTPSPSASPASRRARLTTPTNSATRRGWRRRTSARRTRGTTTGSDVRPHGGWRAGGRPRPRTTSTGRNTARLSRSGSRCGTSSSPAYHRDPDRALPDTGLRRQVRHGRLPNRQRAGARVLTVGGRPGPRPRVRGPARPRRRRWPR